MVRAMIREAKEGNTSASRLVLEHSGKLQKNINITISSPFEKYLEHKDRKQIEPSKEIQRDKSSVDIQDAEVVPERIEKEFQHIDKELVKRKEKLEKSRELYSWSDRAEAVSIPALPPRRPTKGQRLEWEMSIIRAEEEQSNTNAES